MYLFIYSVLYNCYDLTFSFGTILQVATVVMLCRQFCCH